LKLKDVIPWGRNLKEYKSMFNLNDHDLINNKILDVAGGPSSFNYEVTKISGKVVSIDPIYQFTEKEIEQRIKETSYIISEQIKKNKEKFVWKNIKNPEELIKIRLEAMKLFINDYENGLSEKRYVFGMLPNLPFEDNSFDLVLSSHFLIFI